MFGRDWLRGRVFVCEEVFVGEWIRADVGAFMLWWRIRLRVEGCCLE